MTRLKQWHHSANKAVLDKVEAKENNDKTGADETKIA